MKFKWLLLVMLVALFCKSAFSQEKKLASIGGIVKDAHTKLPLNEAVITLSSNVFEGQKFALTDSTGMYMVRNLPAGIYTISFELEGFEKFKQDNIVLKEGMSLGVSFQMIKQKK